MTGIRGRPDTDDPMGESSQDSTALDSLSKPGRLYSIDADGDDKLQKPVVSTFGSRPVPFKLDESDTEEYYIGSNVRAIL